MADLGMDRLDPIINYVCHSGLTVEIECGFGSWE